MSGTLEFRYHSAPCRIVFGAGARSGLPTELERLGLRRALVMSTPGQRQLAEDVAALLGPLCVGVHPHARMHVPVAIAEEAGERVRALGADTCVAVGGGSTIGLAKAVALDLETFTVALPTTLAGSEMTPIWGLTSADGKRTGRDARVLPGLVVYDPELSTTVPRDIRVCSGLNALAHCVEGLYGEGNNPMMSLFAEEGIRVLRGSLVEAAASANAPTLEVCAQNLYGACLAGMVLGGVGMGLHHKLCHTLGGSFDLPHAQVHSVILPHAAAFNSDTAPDAMARVARVLGCGDAATGLFDLAESLGAPTSLRALGMAETDLDRATEEAIRVPYANPAPLTRDGIRTLLDNAYHGRRPVPARS